MFSKFWYHTDWHYFLLPLLNIVWNTKQSELHKYIGLCNTIVRIYKQTNSVRGDKMDFDPIWPVITKLHLALFESLSAFLAAVVSNCVENTHARTDAQCILTQLASQRAWISSALSPRSERIEDPCSKSFCRFSRARIFCIYCFSIMIQFELRCF